MKKSNHMFIAPLTCNDIITDVSPKIRQRQIQMHICIGLHFNKYSLTAYECNRALYPGFQYIRALHFHLGCLYSLLRPKVLEFHAEFPSSGWKEL